jgi:hypothetical protein
LRTLPRGILDQPAIAVKDAPAHCSGCGASLCLRKQVINLALGNIETMSCLNCLSQAEGNSPESLIAGTVEYILSRDCFAKEWVRYACADYCPDPLGCFPKTCFKLGADR